MAFCAHQQWLRVHREEHSFTLQYGNRLQHIAASLPRPTKQYPSLLFFIGKKEKMKALRALFPENTLSTSRKYGVANICANPNTITNDHPVLIAESCLDYTNVELRGAKDTCHETVNYPVNWLGDDTSHFKQSDLVYCVLSRLFCLFIDVLCIFAQDCGNLDGVAEILSTWTARGSASSLPNNVRPRLLVVTSISGHTFDSEALQFRLRVLADPKFSESFSSLNVVNILGTSRSVRMTFSALGEVLCDEAHMARLERVNTHTLFSMRHISAFFDMALLHFTTSTLDVFDFIRASRRENPVSPSFEHHLKSVMSLCFGYKLPDSILWEFIASVIVLDSYPPDMHLFNPSEIFRTLYQQNCILGIHEFSRPRKLSANLICADIEVQMISMFSNMKYSGQSAADLREQSLERSRQYLQVIKSNIDCLFCLQRKPEHPMECGHSICDACVCTFGTATKGMEYYYDLTTCSICQAGIRFQARILPPTCRVRFLGIDGGGSRGVVSLGFMDELQQALDLPYAVQENFDFAIGTSSGGIATIGLFAKNWSPRECLAFFRRFAKHIFPSRKGIRYSLCATIRRIFAFTDSRYDATVLETALKETLGLGPIFESSRSKLSGMKFAVTATTISDATLCLISNYNGEGNHSRDLRYKLLRSRQMEDDILLWEAARCTTAAPSYFEPKYLPAFGTFQDGGLKYNNPVRPGLREVRRIWKNSDCDLVLSIGTGYEQKLVSPVASNFRNLFQDGALARFYRASMESLSLNGQMSWDDHWHGLEEDVKKHHFRLNLPLVGKEPAIDDVDKMQFLHEQIKHHLGDIEGIARAFKAVSFFFELDGPLVLVGGFYTCHGCILSRSPNSRGLVQSLQTTYPYTQFLNNDASLGFLSENDICNLCGRFQKAITFCIRHPSDRVNLQLSFNRLFRRSISGFPQPMEWFVERQKLNARFGQPDHKSRNEPSMDSVCSCELQRRAKISTSAPATKKRSLVVRAATRNKKRCL